MKVTITIKLFARLREIVGTGLLVREVEEKSTVAELVEHLQTEFPQLQGTASQTIISLNQEFVDQQTPLSAGDEIAIFPPVSGGSGADTEGNKYKFAVTRSPLSLDEVSQKVVKPQTGAVAVFGGMVRNVSAGKTVDFLEYEAYEQMAVAKLRQVAAEAREKWPEIIDIAIVQRIGQLKVGEMAVVIAVSSAHRGDGCFEACAYAINRLKEIVPIWKKEVGPDGAEWIEGDYLPSAGDSQ